jgi:hypothetical protein
MYALKRMLLLLALVTVATAQSSEPPLADSRLSIHTLVREDIFAGFLTDDMERLARGEKSIQLLLEKRPNAKADLLAWQAGTVLYRAVRAHEEKRPAEFQRLYARALDLFAQARQITPPGGGVAAVTGGTYVVFADRLPQEHRAAAWAQAYDAYQTLWKQQSSVVDKLPVHLRGELLGGLAISAQRTGRVAEMTPYLDKILEVLRDTPYEPVAKQWKKNPEAAVKGGITCLSCHDGGRLSARLTTLGNK